MRGALVGIALVALGLIALLDPAPGPGLLAGAARETAVPAPPAVAAKTEQGVLDAYGKLPLAFVPNEGQTDARVRYSAQAGGASFYFTQREAVFSFAKGKKGAVLRLAFLGANPGTMIEGERLGAGRVNYLLGSDPAKWRTNLPTYGQVVYRDLWPGIDLAFRGEQGKLKYEFRLAPGASVRDIRLAYAGVDGLGLDRGGNLALRTPLGRLQDSRPMAYQEIGGRRVALESHFTLGAGNAFGFAIGAYDPSRPLVIDPGLVYSTYLGGSGDESGFEIAIDASGSAYVTGSTGSSDFPTTVGAFDTTLDGGSDAFVTKLNATGSALAYSTYLGGSGGDVGRGIAVDAVGNAYVTGPTLSGDFPTTAGAFDTTLDGGSDAFVTKLNATGSALAYSTYLGGSGGEEGQRGGIAVDAAGGAYVTGRTFSGDFPTTAGAFDTTLDVNDAFVTKLNATGSALAYSTYLGGSEQEEGRGIAVDAAGSAYVTGSTISADFPTTAGAFDTTRNGADAFVTKLDATGSALAYSTYLGGSLIEDGNGIAVDGAGSAYVTGTTLSGDFPTTAGVSDTSLGGFGDAFVTKLEATGSALAYSTYLGGSDGDHGFGIAVDAAGNAYVTGLTNSADFSTTAGAFDTSLGGFNDAFVTKLNATGSALSYSTYLGGSEQEEGEGIASDAAGNAYVTGLTSSSDFPTTVGAFDTSANGGRDAFVTKLTTAAVPATLDLSPPAGVNAVGTSHTVTATVEDASGQPVENVIVRFTVTGSVTVSGQCTTGANGQCTFTYQGPALPGGDAINAYADTDGDNTQDVGEPTGAATKTWVLPASTPGCTVSNGGRITAANGDKATFGGNAQVRASGPKGQEQYQDHGPAQPMNVHSINVQAVTCSADKTQASIFGEATINGSGTFDYRIDLKDLGEPGTNDTYRIRLSNGYDSGEKTLEGGNVQIHK